MASINFVANGYNGEVLEDLLVYTAQGNDTFKEGLIHIKPGIQKKYTLPHITLGEIIQDNKATPTSPSANGVSADSKGSYSLSERHLEPNDLMVYLEFDPRDFEEYWRPFQSEGPLIFRELDPKVQSTMLHLLIDRKDSYINDSIWAARKGGVDATTINTPVDTNSEKVGIDLGGSAAAGPMKYFDGFLVRVLNNLKAQSVAEGSRSDAQKNEVASGEVILAGATKLNTGAQVEAALQAMWKKTPARLRKSSSLKFVMSWELWDLYDDYLTAKEVKYVENSEINKRRFKGKQIVVIDGIPAHTIALGKFTQGMDSCLWMGVDYATDHESIKVEPLQANSELWFFQMRMKFDVNIVRPGEIIVWTAYTNVGGPAAPATPTITAAGNSITIACATAGATIQYKVGTGDWTDYSGVITATSEMDNKTLTAKATKDGLTSEEATHTIAYSA